MAERVTQVGLGAIGSIYAGHLIDIFGDVTIFDLDRSRARAIMDEKRGTGARIADSLQEAVAEADFIVVSLPDPTASKAVLQGPSSLIDSAKSGAAILDLSTIDPETARQNHTIARAAGLFYIEAPVSGGEPDSAGVDGARNRNVTFMAGGDLDSFKRVRPLMDALGSYPFLLGPAGTGSTVKLISNYISGLHNLVAAEAFALGKAAGISPETLLNTFAHTDANSYWLFHYFAPRIRSGNTTPGFSVDLQHKDLRLCENLARDLKVAMPLNNLALSLYQALQGQGRGGNDLVDAANLICELSGLSGYENEA